MNAANALLLQHGNEFAHPGCWKLDPARALTLAPTQAGSLRVSQGEIWATLDGPHHGPANDWGDVVLRRGEQLQLVPGQHLVIEPFGDSGIEPVCFSWAPGMAPAQRSWRAPSMACRDASTPAHFADNELVRTMHAVARMLSRIVAMLKDWSAHDRGRLSALEARRALSALETNQP